jgi:ribosome-binding protein aMBF1 (putative translation factor)
LAVAKDVPAPVSSPIGRPASEAAQSRAVAGAEYRRAQETHAASRAIAREVILFRTKTGLTQRELAERLGTSYSAVARLESGRHKPSLETLERLATVMGKRLQITFEE